MSSLLKSSLTLSEDFNSRPCMDFLKIPINVTDRKQLYHCYSSFKVKKKHILSIVLLKSIYFYYTLANKKLHEDVRELQ